MPLTARQWAQLGVTLTVAGAAIVRGVVSPSPTAPNVAPAASQASAGPFYRWPHTIAIDTQTGQLYPGFVNGGWSSPARGLYYCGVATDSLTGRRALTVHVVQPVKYNTLCQSALHQWDSAESATLGRWPKP